MNYFVFRWASEMFYNLGIPYPYNLVVQYIILAFCMVYMLRYIFKGRRY